MDKTALEILYADSVRHFAAKDNSDGSFAPAYKTYQSHNITQDEWNAVLKQLLDQNSDTTTLRDFTTALYQYALDNLFDASLYYTKTQEDSTHSSLQHNIDLEAAARESGLSAKADLLDNNTDMVQLYAVGEHNSWRGGWGLSQTATNGDVAARTNDGRLLAKQGANPTDDELITYKYLADHFATLTGLAVLEGNISGKQDKLIAGAGISIGSDGKTISATTQLQIVKAASVAALPNPGDVSTIYLVPHDSPETNDTYDEYVWNTVDSTYEKMGSIKTVLGQVQADWNQSDDAAVDFIKNKPSIPAAQIQSDWNQSDDTKLDFIKNKPSVPDAVVANPSDEATEILSKLKVGSTIFSVPSGGGEGGSSDYTDLINKPQIAGVTLSGNKTLAELGITSPTIDRLASGAMSSTFTAKSIAQLIAAGYTHVRLTGYSQYAATHQRSWVVSLSDVSSNTIQICETITGWLEPLNIYIFNSDGNLTWNGGTDHQITVILIEGIK